MSVGPCGLGCFQLEPQALMGPAEVVNCSPPLKVCLEFGSELRGGPRAAGECGQALALGQVDPLDESGVDRAGETQMLESRPQVVSLSQLHVALNCEDLASPTGLLDLAMQQRQRDLLLRFARRRIV
jgi:hypothetical protein